MFLVRWKGPLSRTLSDSPPDCRTRPGRKPAVLTGCGARIGRRPLEGSCPLRPRPLLWLPVSAAGGGRLRSFSRPFPRCSENNKKEEVLHFCKTSSLVRWKGPLSRALSDSPPDCRTRPGRKPAGRAFRVPSRGILETTKKEEVLRFRKTSSFGALEGTRTPGLLIRSQTLYPAELPARLQEV